MRLFRYSVSNARLVTISNVHNLVDDTGKTVITGELDVLTVADTSYFYFDNWGCCLDNNCTSPCVYADNHTVLVYKTSDFKTWTYGGVALPVAARQPGILFRPHVDYNPQSKQYIMWYEDRPNTSVRNYAVASSATPLGPFTTIVEKASFKCGNGGDFDIFVDSDGVAYLIVTHYTSFCIEKLDETFTSGTGQMGTIKSPSAAEAPVMFKRNDLYYVLFGTSCCACKEGSNVWVYTASSPLGPYTLLGDIGTQDGKYVTRAQQSTILQVPSEDGTMQYIWLGNQWGTAPDGCYNHDLISWFPLQFQQNNSIAQLTWQNQVTFTIK